MKRPATTATADGQPLDLLFRADLVHGAQSESDAVVPAAGHDGASDVSHESHHRVWNGGRAIRLVDQSARCHGGRVRREVGSRDLERIRPGWNQVSLRREGARSA